MLSAFWRCFVHFWNLARITYALRTVLNGVYGFGFCQRSLWCEERINVYCFEDLFELYRMSYYLCDSDDMVGKHEFMNYYWCMKYCYFCVFTTIHVCTSFDRAFCALSNGVYHCQLQSSSSVSLYFVNCWCLTLRVTTTDTCFTCSGIVVLRLLSPCLCVKLKLWFWHTFYGFSTMRKAQSCENQKTYSGEAWRQIF